MSVIIGRALPDIRDGLKPSHRRVLFGMRPDGPGLEPRVPQVREDRRRGDGQLPSPRRQRHLRHPGAHGAGLQPALPPDRRPGQLRIGRRRPAGGHALYRGAAEGDRRRDDGRPRQGDRRLRPELRRDHHRAHRAAGAVPEPARERIGRHRGRHGDQHPAAQPRRGDRLRRLGDRAPGGLCRSEAVGHVAHPARAGFPDRRHDRRPGRHRAGLPDRPRLGRHPREDGAGSVQAGRQDRRSSSARSRTR